MKISGIYKIQSKIKPERIYIGSANSIGKRRTNHLHKLRHGMHHAIKLQNHYNKYGEDDLIFEILEECSIDTKFAREQYYIDLLNPWFNSCPLAGSTSGRETPEETIAKLKMKTKESLDKWRRSRYLHYEYKPKPKKSILSDDRIKIMINCSHSKPILQYDLDNNFIKEWHGASTAAKALGINDSGIRKCLQGKYFQSYGFIWKYKDSTNANSEEPS